MFKLPYSWVQLLVRLCSKSFKLDFSSMWSKNYEMYKLDLEKAEETEITVAAFIGSWRKQEKSRKVSTSASLTMLKPLWITTNCRKYLERWEYQPILLVSRETCMWIKKQQLEWDMKPLTVSKLGKGEWQSCILSPCLFKFFTEHIMQNARLDETQAGIKIDRKNINNLR